MAKILLRNDGGYSEIALSPAESVLNALLKNGVRIKHACGGKAQCGTCRIKVGPGRDADGKEGGKLSPMGERERLRLAAAGAGPDERLACQTYINGVFSVEPAVD